MSKPAYVPSSKYLPKSSAMPISHSPKLINIPASSKPSALAGESLAKAIGAAEPAKPGK